MLVIHKAVLDMETLNWISIEGRYSEGPVELCCGPGHEEVQQANQEEDLSQQLVQDYNQRYAGQTETLGQINNLLSNLQQGKMLPGFGANEMTALQSGAINSATANAKNVETALNVANAGRGGDSGLQPGTVGQEQATALTGVANQEAAQQQQIQLANANQARQNTAMALGGYSGLAGLQNPEGFGKLANDTNAQAFGEANTISGMYNQGEKDLAGGITGLALNAASLGLAPGIPGITDLGQTNPLGIQTPQQLGIQTTEPQFASTLQD